MKNSRCSGPSGRPSLATDTDQGSNNELEDVFWRWYPRSGLKPRDPRLLDALTSVPGRKWHLFHASDQLRSAPKVCYRIGSQDHLLAKQANFPSIRSSQRGTDFRMFRSPCPSTHLRLPAGPEVPSLFIREPVLLFFATAQVSFLPTFSLEVALQLCRQRWCARSQRKP